MPDHFRFSDYIVIDGFYVKPIASSSGRLSVSLDGPANSLVVFDNKTKYVADMEVSLSKSRKYFIGDTDDFSVLPTLKIKESQSASIIKKSIFLLRLI